jgi:aspartate beta-hydroxylase
VLGAIDGADGPLATFSRFEPGHRLPWHSDGYSFVLSFHMGLVVPPACGLVVGGVPKQLTPGQVEVMASSFFHTAWNFSDQPRIHLIIDFWHPELTAIERAALREFFCDGLPSRDFAPRS